MAKSNCSYNEVVGFLMLGLDNHIADLKEYPVYFLWRFMIGSLFQNKGYEKNIGINN